MPKPRIAILASGGGTTAESFIYSTIRGDIPADVILVISNRPNSGVLAKIKNINKTEHQDIKVLHIGKSNYPAGSEEEVLPGEQTLAEEEAILNELLKAKIDIVFLLGYMKRVGNRIVAKYGWNASMKNVFEASMFNTHPGLLPATGGLFGVKVQEKVLEMKHPNAGHCIFAVDDKYDDGPVITEHKVAVQNNDTPEVLSERVKESEKKYLAEDINYFIKNKYN